MSDAPPDVSTERDLLIGRAIAGRFTIERRLGAGSMGAVYRAHQIALDRPVALKVMRRELAADATYAARFHREAKAASRLDHPNLVRVHDYGQEPDGLLYIAMEYLDCRDLCTLVAEEWPLPPERIADILSQILSGLAEAHDAGVLHRDLNPKNIMIVRRKGEDGTPVDVVKVCDFGIAKFVEPADPSKTSGAAERRKLTTAGLVLGTPDYMSPEQARGEPYDARGDVYAVGVILYELLTRRLPFEGKTTFEVVFKAMHSEPARLDSHGVTAAPALDAVCIKAISRRPEDRYQSAREMRAAVQAVLATAVGPAAPSFTPVPTREEPSAPLAAASDGAGVSVPRAMKARRRVLGGMLVAVVVALSAGALLIAQHPPHRIAPTSASFSVLRVEEPPPSAPPAPPMPSELAPPAPLRHSRATVAAVPNPTTQAPAPSATQTASASTSAPSPFAPPARVPSVTVASPSPLPQQPPPSFNLKTARVELGSAKSNNAVVTSGSVSRAFGPLVSRFTACYRSALAEAPGAANGAIAVLHVESDEEGYVTVARMTGASSASAARCIETVSREVHLVVDTGSANVDVTLLFKPL